MLSGRQFAPVKLLFEDSLLAVESVFSGHYTALPSISVLDLAIA
jgi:hypothetical protein